MFVRVVTREKQTNLDDGSAWRENEGEGEGGKEEAMEKGAAEGSAKRDSHRGGEKTYSLVQYLMRKTVTPIKDADSEQPNLAPRRLREYCNG
jgi:hypothetical protein